MNYFITKEDMVEKSAVVFEREKLEKLRLVVINNCSEIIPREYEGFEDDYRISRSDYTKIRNFKQVKIRDQRLAYNELFDRVVDWYRFTFDEYQYPHLVQLIDMLLKEDVSALNEVYNPTIDTRIIPFEERIKLLSKELDAISNLDMPNKKAKLEELERLIEQAELNKNQKSVMEYYPVAQSLITLTLIDTISVAEVKRVEEFQRVLK